MYSKNSNLHSAKKSFSIWLFLFNFLTRPNSFHIHFHIGSRDMGVFENRETPPQKIIQIEKYSSFPLNYFHHPFWGRFYTYFIGNYPCHGDIKPRELHHFRDGTPESWTPDGTSHNAAFPATKVPSPRKKRSETRNAFWEWQLEWPIGNCFTGPKRLGFCVLMIRVILLDQ